MPVETIWNCLAFVVTICFSSLNLLICYPGAKCLFCYSPQTECVGRLYFVFVCNSVHRGEEIV